MNVEPAKPITNNKLNFSATAGGNDTSNSLRPSFMLFFLF